MNHLVAAFALFVLALLGGLLPLAMREVLCMSEVGRAALLSVGACFSGGLLVDASPSVWPRRILPPPKGLRVLAGVLSRCAARVRVLPTWDMRLLPDVEEAQPQRLAALVSAPWIDTRADVEAL